jgi:hypothetical protein
MKNIKTSPPNMRAGFLYFFGNIDSLYVCLVKLAAAYSPDIS